ncbi:MAG: PEP-CTERM sorting domain-containing protein [Verrucomicrobiae bacterium]|nr:PEP-CTERM sorting domain-containing protein [Verrucomicrobiae bacterium]
MKYLHSCVALGVLSFTGLTASAAVVVANGDFEQDAELFVVWPGYVGGTNDSGTNPAAIPGWTNTGGVGINPVVPGAASDSPFDDPSTSNPTHFAFIQGVASIAQIVGGFTVGENYVLSLDTNARGCCGDVPIADILLDGSVIASSVDAFPEPGGVVPADPAAPWYHFDIPFVATSESHEISIATRPAAGGDASLVVDNVGIAAVPEPATGFLAIMGMGFMLLRRRR